MYRKIIITRQVWKEIENTIGNISPEAGGILGRENEKVVAYYFDRTGGFLENKYIPNIKQINKVIADWTEQGISFCGFIHSHPSSHVKPSYGDIEYIAEQTAIDLENMDDACKEYFEQCMNVEEPQNDLFYKEYSVKILMEKYQMLFPAAVIFISNLQKDIKSILSY